MEIVQYNSLMFWIRYKNRGLLFRLVSKRWMGPPGQRTQLCHAAPQAPVLKSFKKHSICPKSAIETKFISRFIKCLVDKRNKTDEL